MLKKIALGILLTGVVAVLIFGAIQRTSGKVGEEQSLSGQGNGRQGWANGEKVEDIVEQPLVESNLPETTLLSGRGGQGGGRQGWSGGGQPVGTSEQPLAESSLSAAQPGALDEAEAEGLLYMREEEKLARDVYLALYETWGLPVFQNIAASEQAHMDALLSQLSAYGLKDPAAGTAQGEFTNPELQALYHQLIEQGQRSLADALKVGAAIEEIDILDLDERSVLTDEAGIQSVYANLKRGSENHLRSFTRTLQQQTGEVYSPQYMSAEEYQATVSTTNGNGGNSRGRRGGRP